MMLRKILGVVFAISTALAGCDSSRIREFRGAFIQACRGNHFERDQCSCMFDEIRKKYKDDQLLQKPPAVNPSQYTIDYINAAAYCQGR
jgi:hypothetical protein